MKIHNIHSMYMTPSLRVLDICSVAQLPTVTFSIIISCICLHLYKGALLYHVAWWFMVTAMNL